MKYGHQHAFRAMPLECDYHLKFRFEKVLVFGHEAVCVVNHAAGIVLHAELQASLQELQSITEITLDGAAASPRQP
jgi:hypothetical protein